MTDERTRAYTHIRANLPPLERLIDVTGEVPVPQSDAEPVPDALVRIVAGQMLSRMAAQSIVRRMAEAAERLECGPLYRLPEEELRASGLSGRKARTIALIREIADAEPERLENWRKLPFEELATEVSGIWGLSNWSASVLGIFHFGHPDVFPLSDGSLVRAIRLVEQETGPLEFDAAAPYRSYLALTLWAALDNGHLKGR